MRFSTTLDDIVTDADAREALKNSVPESVLNWFCSDNNRVYNQLKNATADRYTDFQVLNDRLSRLNVIVVEELKKIASDLSLDFWQLSDIFGLKLLMPRFNLVHTTEDDLIPQELRDFINKEHAIKERIKHEKELLKKSREEYEKRKKDAAPLDFQTD